jgi:hypothetical protein
MVQVVKGPNDKSVDVEEAGGTRPTTHITSCGSPCIQGSSIDDDIIHAGLDGNYSLLAFQVQAGFLPLEHQYTDTNNVNSQGVVC